MFTVTINNKKDTTYHVFNKGEFYQPLVPFGAHFAVNKDKYEIDTVLTHAKGIIVIIKNKNAIIISDDDYKSFINNTTGVLARWETAPITEITDSVYDMLFKLHQTEYKETEEYKKETEIQKDINVAEKQFSKQKGLYRTF